jgi:hypothetical protein
MPITPKTGSLFHAETHPPYASLPNAVISFDLAPNIEIAVKLPTIEKGCQENSSDAALQLSSTGWRGAQGNRGLATLCRQRTTPRSVPNPEAHLQ